MNLNFNNVEVKEGPSYVQPGVSEFLITEIKEGVMPFDDKVPCISIKVEDLENKSVYVENFSMKTEKSPGKEKAPYEWSLERIKHLGTKIISEDDFNSIQNVNQMSAKLVGSKVRLKFGAREYLSNDNVLKVVAKLPFSRFAESISIPKEKSSLKYDPKNKYDYESYEGPMPEASTNESKSVNNTGEKNYLPF
jgi:hypothetical protein